MKIMKIELVEFPEWSDPGYRDSGEGGLFVMLFVPEPEGWEDNCCVDVGIEASRPDVLVHPRQEDLGWQPYRWDEDRQEAKVMKLVREQNDPAMFTWMCQTRGPEYRSAPMLVAMLLGSTSGSFYSEHNSGYWYATRESLTEAGRALYDGIKAAYGVEPILATFLDT